MNKAAGIRGSKVFVSSLYFCCCVCFYLNLFNAEYIFKVTTQAMRGPNANQTSHVTDSTYLGTKEMEMQ